jgi:hypothetical protein
MLKTHREQILFWKNIIEDQMGHFSEVEDEDFLKKSLQRLLKQDPFLKGFFHMDEAVKDRERGFLKNSIKGFTGYLVSKRK